ncbi:hypothetical protein N665_0017s0021 [Sinapis alba]|nr:hypothetical protein N665_0017s0021 [Sinapis alba]
MDIDCCDTKNPLAVLHYKFEQMEETLYLIINIIDMFLAVHHHVAMNKLQLKSMAYTLEFNFCLPAPYVVMRRFLEAAQSDKKIVELLSFSIIELCLVEYEMLQYTPSKLASSAIYTTQSTLKRI